MSSRGFENFNGGLAFIDGDRVYSYHHTAYMQGDKQRTGTLGYRNGDHFSLQWENDAWAGSSDKYRSNAIELGTKGYFIGSNVYTHNHKKSEDGLNKSGFLPKQLWRKLVHSYPDAETQSSPFYIGKKKGNTITRIGYDHPLFGDVIQNGFHFLIGSPYFGQGNYSTPFYQTGTYLPYSMY